jgi:hypothetical protein
MDEATAGVETIGRAILAFLMAPPSDSEPGEDIEFVPISASTNPR